MPIHVDLVPRTIPADDQTLAERLDIAERLGELGYLDPADGHINTGMIRWHARIGSVDIPLDSVTVDLDNGTPTIGMIFQADTVTIGEAAPAPEAKPEQPPLTPWGAPGVPDPRAGIPGWTPEAAQEVSHG